jgi:glycosyltransferase involved in cell wall biosynthesis
MATLRDARPSLKLLLVGDGPLEEVLRRRAAALGLADRVCFLGVRRDLATVLAALDVFAIASLWEGLPLALVWAMGAGLPVVATTAGGIPEAVDEGQTGLLVPPGDATALAGALDRLLDDPRGRAGMGQQAQRQARARFGIEAHLDALVQLYRQGLAARARRARR